MTTEKVRPLENSQVYKIGSFDKSNRWYPRDDLAEYFHQIRKPSHAWPLSWFRAAKTQKFVKWLKNNKPQLLQQLNY